jgi:hypothetical protein
MSLQATIFISPLVRIQSCKGRIMAILISTFLRLSPTGEGPAWMVRFQAPEPLLMPLTSDADGD